MESALKSPLTINFTTVKEAIVSVLSSAKAWTLWMGRQVVAFAALCMDTTKAGLLALIDVVAMVWREALPYLIRVAAFLASEPGIFGMGILASVLILRMALSDDNLTDPTGRSALAVIGSTILFFTGVYGAQADFAFIPHIVAKDALLV